MSQTLKDIAQQLSTPKTVRKTVPETTKEVEEDKPVPKVQLIYAFNGTGKTRLSREFEQLIAADETLDTDAIETVGEASDVHAESQEAVLSREKILYYNAFTEDLFHWDNGSAEPKLEIQSNSFTDWILVEQGLDQRAIGNFQRYTDDKLTPRFHLEPKERVINGKKIKVQSATEVTFTLEAGDEADSGMLKISKGEESNFIWSIFYTLLDQVIAILNVAEPDERETNEFDNLEYVFIDDPVSSLDDNHLIELAVDLAQLVKSNASTVKFIITTHNPLFYNVLCNEFGSNDNTHSPTWQSKWLEKSRLEKNEDGSHELVGQPNDSPFSYHLQLLSQLQEVIKSGQIEKYHFNLLRNILEKTATFLGYKRWEELLPKSDDSGPNPYAKRIVNFSSHSKHAAEEVTQLKPEEKKVLENLVNHLVNECNFLRKGLDQ